MWWSLQLRCFQGLAIFTPRYVSDSWYSPAKQSISFCTVFSESHALAKITWPASLSDMTGIITSYIQACLERQRKLRSYIKLKLKLKIPHVAIHWHPHQKRGMIIRKTLRTCWPCKRLLSDQYLLSRNTGAGRHDIDILEAGIQDYPNIAFLSLFRMHRASFHDRSIRVALFRNSLHLWIPELQ